MLKFLFLNRYVLLDGLFLMIWYENVVLGKELILSLLRKSSSGFVFCSLCFGQFIKLFFDGHVSA